MRGLDAYQSQLNPKHPVIDQYLDLVKKVALHIKPRLPNTLELEDLLQVGLMALLEAYERFDASKGVQFECFARLKVRGAMIDLARKSDWVPRELPRQMREIRETRRQLEQQFSRAVSDREVLNNLEMNEAEYYTTLRHYSAVNLESLDDLVQQELNSFESVSGSHIYSSYETDNKFSQLEKADELSAIAKHIEALNEKQKLVMALYYVEEMNMKEIAQVLEVSESRVCQLHSEAISAIKHKWQ